MSDDTFTEQWHIDILAKGVKLDVTCCYIPAEPSPATRRFTVAGKYGAYKHVNFTNENGSPIVKEEWVKRRQGCYVFINRSAAADGKAISIPHIEPISKKVTRLEVQSLGSIEDLGHTYHINLYPPSQIFEELERVCSLYIANSRKVSLILRLNVAIRPWQYKPICHIFPFENHVLSVAGEVSSYYGWPV